MGNVDLLRVVLYLPDVDIEGLENRLLEVIEVALDGVKPKFVLLDLSVNVQKGSHHLFGEHIPNFFERDTTLKRIAHKGGRANRGLSRHQSYRAKRSHFLDLLGKFHSFCG